MRSAQKIEQYMVQLGLKSQAIHLYLELAKNQPSILHLAKSLGISRTQVYRHLDILMRYNLVNAEVLPNGTRYRALPLDNIETVIIERQTQLKNMKTNLTSMTQLVREFVADKDRQSGVRHYYGLGGLKQANWNLTKARGEYRVFEAASLLDHFPKEEQFVRRCNEEQFKNATVHGTISYDLTNHYPSLADMDPIDLTHTKYRYIDPKILTIDFELYIYNGVVTLLDYDPTNMHAIEIEHPILFRMIYQIYNLLWEMATPIRLPEDLLRVNSPPRLKLA